MAQMISFRTNKKIVIRSGYGDKIEEIGYDYPVSVVNRDEWGARPPTSVVPLVTPATRVGVTFNSGSEECNTKDDCIRVLKGIQNVHMDEYGMSDIAYNWMVGGDGRVYEGRGWEGVPNVSLENPNANFTKMVEITFIGEFDGPNKDPGNLFNTMENFVKKGIKDGKIIKEYEMK